MTGEELAEDLGKKCPSWASGTLLLRDEAGGIVGYGWLRRTGEESAEVRVTSSPSGVALFSASPPPEDA